MIIGCPDCATKFGIPDGALGDVGRKVRCAKCGHVWLATKEDAIEMKETAKPDNDTLSPPQPTEDFSEPHVDAYEEDQQDEEPESSSDDSYDHETDEENIDPDVQGLGDKSVEEALAVIKGTAIEEPDFPLAKGEINEFEVIASSKGLIIGWSALGVFLISILLVFFLMQETLRQVWPPITKLYDVVGILDTSKGSENDTATDAVVEDLSKYIRISNEAALERLANGDPALVIRGSVTNSADFDIQLPSAEAVLRNERRQDILVWPFEFDETVLRAGKTMPFVEAVPNPPRETTEFELMLLWEK